MSYRMDEDNPSEYCCKLWQVDKEQFQMKGRIVDLEIELSALETDGHKDKGENIANVRVDKYDITPAKEVAERVSDYQDEFKIMFQIKNRISPIM